MLKKCILFDIPSAEYADKVHSKLYILGETLELDSLGSNTGFAKDKI